MSLHKSEEDWGQPFADSGTGPFAVDELVGTVVDGRYRIEQRLASGGMGNVYVAEHLALRKRVALKVVHPTLADEPEAAARFAREAMACARLDHPHVATVIDYGTLPSGAGFLAMQLVRGSNLRERLDDSGALEWNVAVEVAAQVADALVAAHDAGIIHRDLKPDNLLLEARSDGSFLAKVLDFGVARVRLEGVPNALEAAAPGQVLTRLGTVVGTPGYMAPEQAMGETVEAQADLYSVGVMLWEMLVGERLFPESDLTAIVTRQLMEPPARVNDVAAEKVPKPLEDLVARLLRPKAGERIQSAEQVRDELRRLAYGARVERESTEQLRLARKSAVATETTRASDHRWTIAGAVGGLMFGVVLALGAVVAFNAPAPSSVPAKVSAAPPTAVAESEPPPTRAPAIRATLETLLEGRRRLDRRQAAREVLETPEVFPPFAEVVARFEDTGRCSEQRDAIAEMVSLGDSRAVPALRRVVQAPTSGCGFLSLSDCYGCVRPAAEAGVQALGDTP